jgi:hypothetical protein
MGAITQEHTLQERDKMKEENNKNLNIKPMHTLIEILIGKLYNFSECDSVTFLLFLVNFLLWFFLFLVGWLINCHIS